MKTIALALFFLFVPTQRAFASFEAARDSFCKDPFQYVCNDASSSLLEFRRRRKATAEKAFAATIQALKNKITPGAMKAIYDGIVSANDPLSPKKREVGMEVADIAPYFQGIRHYLSEVEKLSGWKKTHINEAIAKMKQLHFDRIDSERSFTREQREEMKKKVAEVRVLAFDEIFSFFEEMGIKWDRDLETSVSLLGNFATSCGADYLRDNAGMRECAR